MVGEPGVGQVVTVVIEGKGAQLDLDQPPEEGRPLDQDRGSLPVPPQDPVAPILGGQLELQVEDPAGEGPEELGTDGPRDDGVVRRAVLQFFK